jgi:hypothetical protein
MAKIAKGQTQAVSLTQPRWQVDRSTLIILFRRRREHHIDQRSSVLMQAHIPLGAPGGLLEQDQFIRDVRSFLLRKEQGQRETHKNGGWRLSNLPVALFASLIVPDKVVTT